MAGLGADGIALSLPSQHRSLAGHKRKRDDLDDKRCKPFDIRPVDDRSASAILLTPKHLLPRAHLPLSWLDPSQGGSRLYSANIHLLESTYERGLPASVLVAEDGQRRHRFALERASHRRYAVFRLVSSLEPTVLARRAIWSAPTTLPELPRTKEKDTIGGDLRPKRRLVPTALASLPTECNIRDAETSIPAEAQTVPPSPPSSGRNSKIMVPFETPKSPVATKLADTDESLEELSKQIEPDDAFQELAKQYLDALYLSKTSLAYFVKGPLSRIRSLFSEQSQAGPDPTQLICFLREVLLSISTTDQRLKKNIPDIVNEASQHLQSYAVEPKKKSRKRKWKAKRDKHGFFVGEVEHILDWWHRQDSVDTSSLRAAPTLLKEELAKVRTRETLLQVIITLEILALESIARKGSMPGLSSSKDAAATSTAEQLAHSDTQDVARKSKKKPILLDRHLEALLDRLVIWHSLESHSPMKSDTDNNKNNNQTHGQNDQLKSFCVEVIVPFFLPRIPKIATTVNKKLGGPTARSPLKRELFARRPGEPASRNPLEMKDHAEQRHRSDSTRRRESEVKPPSILHRSATDSQLAGMRHARRDSSASLSLASVKSLRPESRRTASSALDSLTRREIDLTAASAVSKEKLRKRTEQEAKVREAIAGIRKPDRSSALQENAALVDAKFAQTLQRSRKPAHTTKRVDAAPRASVHIQATPRFSKTVSATPRHSTHQATTSLHARYDTGSHLAPPTTSIPQTGRRPRTTNALAATPSRGAERYHVAESVNRIAFDKSPLLSRTKIVESTPSRPTALFSVMQSSPADPPSASLALSRTEKAVATPATSMGLEEASPNAVQNTPKAAKSIYDALGWNEEYEELA